MTQRIEVYDGKYTVVMSEEGTISEVLRYGETWPAATSYQGSGFILALAQEILELRGVADELKMEARMDRTEAPW